MSTENNEIDLGENPDLQKEVVPDSELKQFIIQYVGEKTQPENHDVTVAHVVEVFMKEFPEFLLAIAEENWVRGYHQAFVDIEEGEKLAKTEGTETETEEDGT